MAVFSRAFIRRRVISLATTASVAATSMALAHGPKQMEQVHRTRPGLIQRAAATGLVNATSPIRQMARGEDKNPLRDPAVAQDHPEKPGPVMQVQLK